MKKVFISQPMRGKTIETIRKEREAIVKYFEKRGYEVLDSIIADSPEDAVNEPIYYLSKSIELLAQADLVYFMKDWESARGCYIEFCIAVEYEIDFICED